MNRVDEKGKLFTERVRKYTVEAEIVTVHGIVHGSLHPKPGQRVKDLLNTSEEQFLAVTGATIRKHDGTHSRQAGFIAVNKAQIISVEPVREEMPPGLEDEY